MNIDRDKISAFERAVTGEAEKRVEEIEQEIRDYEKSELEKEKNLQHEKMFAYMQSQVQAVKSKYKRELTKYELDSKRRLVQYRNDLSKQVLAQTEQKLAVFADSKQYRDYLLQSIKAALEHFPYPDYAVLLRQEDMVYVPFLEQTLSGEFQASAKVRIGGFILHNEEHGVLLDRTLYTILQDKMQDFYRECGLKVEL